MADYNNQSLQRAMQIMELISDQPKGMTLAEICRSLNLNKTIAYRLLITLTNGGWLSKDIDNRFVVGIKLISLFCNALEEVGFDKIIKPYIQDIAVKYGETVVLAVYSNHQAICIEKFESDSTVRITAQLGRSFPVYAGATGLSVLMGMSDEQAYRALEYHRDVEDQNFDVEKTMKLIRNSKEKGYIITTGMVDNDVLAIGIPISIPMYKQYFSLSVVGPAYRFPQEKITAIVEELKTISSRIAN